MFFLLPLQKSLKVVKNETLTQFLPCFLELEAVTLGNPSQLCLTFLPLCPFSSPTWGGQQREFWMGLN